MASLKRRLQRSALALLWLACLLAIAMPGFSPFVTLVDHHWIERLPIHTHLKLDGTAAVPPHHHLYEATHQHAANHRPVVTVARVALFNFDDGQTSNAFMIINQPALVSTYPIGEMQNVFPLLTSTTSTALAGLSVSPEHLPPRGTA